MTRLPSFLEDPDDTQQAIMKATYVALCEHGYSNLTIQRIGDEFSKSKSLLYHHYDSKDELLLDFLDFILDRYEDQIPAHEDGRYEDSIEGIARGSFEFDDPEVNLDFTKALVELRAQAAHDEQFREYFTRTDHFMRKYIAHTIRAGIEKGVFREADPQETAALFMVVITGSMVQHATGTDELLEDAGNAFERYVQEHLLESDETTGSETDASASRSDAPEE
ncbi:TetR/AcrR family transcriptional regulator [Natrinema sp. 74]|uniref:TetR/AcrR family transcriptional regulator n=1 Tax=Natrinema sp. 74 TaxID=3384159 RepID=UPI0038D4D6A0